MCLFTHCGTEQLVMDMHLELFQCCLFLNQLHELLHQHYIQLRTANVKSDESLNNCKEGVSRWAPAQACTIFSTISAGAKSILFTAPQHIVAVYQVEKNQTFINKFQRFEVIRCLKRWLVGTNLLLFLVKFNTWLFQDKLLVTIIPRNLVLWTVMTVSSFSSTSSKNYRPPSLFLMKNNKLSFLEVSLRLFTLNPFSACATTVMAVLINSSLLSILTKKIIIHIQKKTSPH